MIRVLFIFGTRPEAIKLCPVIRHMRERADEFRIATCVTAQHRDMLDQVLASFAVEPDHDLNLMSPGQTLFQSTSAILPAIEPVLAAQRPDIVLVQGDTTSTLCGALAAFYGGVPVGHVEAGLRTGDLRQPFPEEMNRVLTTRLATLHFAPTEGAAENLRAEGVPPERITVTGNSGIDAVLHVSRQLEAGNLPGARLPAPARGKRLVLVTAHRRESFGEGIERTCRALVRLSRRSDVHIVFPVHPNPLVRRSVESVLEGVDNISLVEPLAYVPFVDLMRKADLILTDSGGIQEEAPSLGVPVLVLRDKTERPEAVRCGTATLVGTDVGRIVAEAERRLDSPKPSPLAAGHSPFGDGSASRRIADATHTFFCRNSS